MNYTHYFIIILLAMPAHATEIITLFLRQYPYSFDDEHTHTTAQAVQQPGQLAHYTLHGLVEKNPVAGIFATYAGYLGLSDNNGQIVFARRHTQPEIFLIITPQIAPMFMAGFTIHHWEFVKNAPTQVYHLERHYDDDAKAYFWDTQVASLPENNRVPLEAIVLFAKPQNIYVPTGITPTDDRPNLVLPDIYVKKGPKIYADTFVLAMRQFFGPVDRVYKIFDTGYQMQVEQ